MKCKNSLSGEKARLLEKTGEYYYHGRYEHKDAYNHAGIVAYFSRVASCDWEFPNELRKISRSIYQGISPTHLVKKRIDALRGNRFN